MSGHHKGDSCSTAPSADLCTDRREASWTPVLGVTEREVREVREASGPGG